MISLTSPVRTTAHGWPAGAKLAALCLATTSLFMLQPPALHLAAFAATLLVYALPGRAFFTAGMRALRILIPFVVLVFLWHLYTGDMVAGMRVILRMTTVVAMANLVTMTTSLESLSDVVRWLSTPLRRLGLRTEALDLAIPLVVRFTPVITRKSELLRQSWRARSRRRPGWRLLFPLALQALDDADHVALALRARSAPMDKARRNDP